MGHLFSFLKGLIFLAILLYLSYRGLVLLNNWNYGVKGLIAVLIVFPLVLIGVGHATKIITFNKLGSTATFFIGLFILICLGGVQKMNWEKQQVAGYTAVAEELDLEYSRHARIDSTLGSNPIFESGLFDMGDQMLTGKYNDVEVMIFNYQYETLGDDTPDHYFRTVAVFGDRQRSIPDFQMQSETLGDKIFGKDEIDFKTDPDFSKKYCLIGPDEKAIRNLFGPEQRRAFLESKRNWSVAGMDYRIAIYADDKMDEQVEASADAIKAYLQETFSLCETIRKAAPLKSETSSSS